MKLVVVVSMIMAMSLTGCSALKEFGKDIKRTGQVINDDMQKTKK